MSDWQPIETAPRDGNYVLVCIADEEYGEANPLICQYDRGTSTGNWRIALDGQHLDPTHWMPLPSPPVIVSPLPTAHGTTGEQG